MADGRTVVTETVKVTRQTYPQNWPAYNAAQTQEKSQLQGLLYDYADPFLSLSRDADARASRWLTSSLPARFKSTRLSQGRRFSSD